jgi:surfeit locus 1 family protein
MASERRRFPVGLTIASLIAFVILIGLGVWQVKRLAWKTDMLAHIEALQHAPAQPLTAALARGGDLEFTRVEIDCPGLAGAPFGTIYAVQEGQIGRRLVSACKGDLGRYDGVLVDRGLITDSTQANPPVVEGGPSVHVVGVLRKGDRKPPRTTEGGSRPLEISVGANGATTSRIGAAAPPLWFGRHLATAATYLGLKNPAPYFLMAETATNPDFPALKPVATPTDIPNNHLSYAITWFGLAAALVGVYAALLRKTLKGR